MKRKFIVVVLALPALLFIATGLRWLIGPAGVSPELGLTLESGLGLSTQIGDLSAFFLVAGLCILVGLVTTERIWFYPAIMLLITAALGRTVAWSLHGAMFASHLIVFEIVVALLLLLGSRLIAE